MAPSFFSIHLNRFLAALCSFFTVASFAQSVDPARIQSISGATVKVSVEGSRTSGTGFYIAPSGELLTSWHVIEPAFVTSADGKLTVRPIYIEESSGRKREVSVPVLFFDKLYTRAVENDYCVLAPVKKDGSVVPFLKTGDFNQLVAGQELYAAGFPSNSSQPFISKGWFMNRFTDSSFARTNGVTIKREAALADMTTSMRFSGGPVIRPGLTPADDEVVGWISFLSSPYGRELNRLASVYADKKETTTDMMDDMPAAVFRMFSDILGNATTHISAFYSINPFLRDVKGIQR